MQQQMQGGDPAAGTIHSLSLLLAVPGAGYLILEYWANFNGSISNYFLDKIPEYADLAIMLSPWFAGLALVLAVQLALSTVFMRLRVLLSTGSR